MEHLRREDNMTFNKALISVGLFVFALLAWGSAAKAAPAEQVHDIRPAYNTGAHIVGNGVVGFWAVYQRWPASWAEVVQSGIVQVTPRTEEGFSIDPDDRKIDFLGDVMYFPPERDGELPHLKMQVYVNGMRLHTQRINTNYDHKALWAWTPQNQRHALPSATDARLKQLAIATVINASIQFLVSHRLPVPQNWDELIDTGVLPIDRESINPLTGKPFLFDGSRNDLLLVTGRVTRVLPITHRGEPFPVLVP